MSGVERFAVPVSGSLWPRTLGSVLMLLAALLAAGAVGASTPATQPGARGVDFSSPQPLIELKTALSPYHSAAGVEPDGSRWYLVTAVNQSVRSITRVLVAGEPADIGLRILPRRARPAIRQIASSDADVVVENASGYGRHCFRISIPPASSVALALRMSDADAQPEVAAWSEPALAAHNRQLAVFFAAAAGLIAAALAITAGLAVMTGHAAPRWAAATLGGVFLTRLASAGLFDAAGVTAVGGPYGLSAMLAGLSLAAGIRLADTIAPFSDIWVNGRQWLNRGLTVLVGLSIFALLGVPATMLLTEIAVVFGAGGITAYLVHSGRLGGQAARVAAPSAAVFALVVAAAAAAALGGFESNPAAPAIIGGFAAAGAVLLALAIAAGEGIAILPARRVTPAKPPPGLGAGSAEGSHALLAIGASHQGVFDLDLESGATRLSGEGATLIGLKSGGRTFRHAQWIARIHAEDREVYVQAIEQFRQQPGLAFRIEFRVLREGGSYSWFELRATMMGEADEAGRCLGLLADVTARKAGEAAAAERTLRDTLTGLGNRVALMEELDQLGNRLSEALVAIVDVDRFKSIHASLGDSGGDAVLVELARRLATKFSGSALTFRVGGDGFAVLFAKTDIAGEAIGADLVEVCRSPIEVADREVFAPVSVGLAPGSGAEDGLKLLRNAELALMQAKREGGDCARIYTSALQATAPGDAVALETDLRRALDEGRIDLCYQPIVQLRDGSLGGFEALLRWNHPTRGLVAPGEFIAHSEETGLIVRLGRFALERAAGDLAQWQRFFPRDPPLFVSVNFSRRQLQDDEFERLLAGLLSANAVEPGTLKLEITESGAIATDGARDMLFRLKACGAGLAIDDFGTGASALSQLKDLPFDTVKIDRSFLAQHGATHEDADGAAVLRSIVNLAHELGRTVVVEGVENARDARWLNEIGCEFAQGYYFSEPLPRADVLSYIASHQGGREKDDGATSGVTGVS